MGDAAIHVYSPAAAPRILRALPAQLSPSRLAAGASVTAVSAAVDLHNLLCETSDPADAPSRAEADVVRAHAAALDDYVAHVESLAESSRPDPSKRAAAILLGQLCRDCAPRRFVTSLARWAAALVALVKPDKDALPTPVARGAARAVRHLLDRAASMMDVPGVRKEAATVAQRAATTAARWLDDVGIDDPSLAADALALIRAALHGHPAALRPRVDALERTLVETMCLAVDPDVVAAAVECVVATPRAGAVAGASAGEGAVADAATAWSSLARRIAIAAHDVLDVALRGAEPTDASSSARAALLPPGETKTPPPFGGDANPAVARVDGARAVFRATRLLECLAALLRASFPNAAVPVPADVVLALATRAASPDGAAVAAAPGLPSVAIPAETLAAFPALHVAAANLTTALVRCGGGTIARLAGAVARRVESNVRAGGGIEDGAGKSRVATCASSRAATYRLAAAAARAFGPAYAANELAAVVVPAAAADAVGGWRGVGSSVGSNGGRAAFAAAASRRASAANVSSKRRKKGGAWGQAGAEEMEAFLAAGGLLDRRGGTAGGSAGAAAYAVRAAALDALDATLVAGGAAMSPRLRTLADAAVAEAAASAVAAATAAPSTAAFVEATSPAAIAARRAAYDALLSSTLAPRAFRPENLPLAVATFRAARRADPALGDRAGRALLTLEAMMHPAAPPLHASAIAPPRAERNAGGGMGGLVAAWGDDGEGFGTGPSERGGWRAREEPNWGGDDDDESEEEEEEEEEEELVKEVEDVEMDTEDAEAPQAARTTKSASEPDAKLDVRESEPDATDATEPAPEPAPEVSPTTRSTRGRSKVASAPESAKTPAKASKPKRLTAKEKRAAEAKRAAERRRRRRRTSRLGWGWDSGAERRLWRYSSRTTTATASCRRLLTKTTSEARARADEGDDLVEIKASGIVPAGSRARASNANVKSRRRRLHGRGGAISRGTRGRARRRRARLVSASLSKDGG